MAAHVGAFIDIESCSSSENIAPSYPTSAYPKHLPPAAKPHNNVTISNTDLDALTFGTRYTGPLPAQPSPLSQTPTKRPTLPDRQLSTQPTTPFAGAQTPQPLLIDDAPASRNIAGLLPTWSSPPMNKWRILSCCVMCFGNGIMDSSAGALIPSIQDGYGIGYAIVSLIFVTQALGFISAAFFNELLMNRLGRARTLILAESIMLVGLIMIVTTPPFPVVVIAYFCLGYAEAANLAVINTFCANLAQSTTILGAVHGSYGIGGIVGPIAATLLVSSGAIWSRDYLIPLGIRVLCIFIAGWTFRGYELEAASQFRSALEQTAQEREEGHKLSKTRALLKALNTKTTLFGAMFIFAYQGAEVSISGWVISYLIQYREGDPSKVGYVTAGFWGGITLGRFLLAPFASKTGERLFATFLTLGAITLQILVWQVPSLIADSIVVSLVGLLLGPIYPCATTVFARLLPREIQTTGLSFIASAGSSGGAVAPFLTGLLAQAAGTYVLHPICVGLFAGMLGVWWLLPKVEKRRE